jgi:GPI inositol-deacylase
MGGIVAKTLLTLANYRNESVNTIITLATPHSFPPVPYERKMIHLYNSVNNQMKRRFEDNSDSGLVLVSIA